MLLETLSPGAQAGSAVPTVGLHAATCLSPASSVSPASPAPASSAEGLDAPVPATAAPRAVTPSGAGAVLSVTGNEAAR